MTPQTITIPAAGTAAGVFTIHASGKYFLLTATSGAFRIITNQGDEYDFSETGSGFGNDQSHPFGALTFYNDGGVAVTITFYVSNSPIKTPDVNVTSTINVTQAPVSNTLAGCALAAEGQFEKTTAGAAVALANAGTYFRSAILIAQKTLDRGANTGTVYIGNALAHQPIALAQGDTYEISAPQGAKRDFGNWYIAADNAGDGVTVIYV